MSNSFGNSGREPQRPPRRSDPAQPQSRPRRPSENSYYEPPTEHPQGNDQELNLFTDEPDEDEGWQEQQEYDNDGPDGYYERRSGEVRRARPENNGKSSYYHQRIEPNKRVVALIIDCLAFYIAGMMVMVAFLIVHIPGSNTTWLLLLLVRDYLFEGRGIGKNLMGLQVVDAKSGRPCSLKQSVLRNIIILAPIAVLQVISVILAFLPIPWLTETVKNLVNVVGMVYLATVLPIECYRAYSRDDSLRLGDVWAGTAVIEAPMDFSRPFQK